MEFLLLMLLLAPFASLFSGDGANPPDGEGDVEQTGAGDDDLDAQAGKDTAFLAGEGDDSLNGADGSDVLAGQGGNDVISGGTSGDVILGGSGDDSMYGNEGNDIMVGGAGDDLVQSGAGNDIVVSGGGEDTIRGYEGNDFIDGRDVNGKLIASASAVMPDSVENQFAPYLKAAFGDSLSANQITQLQAELLSSEPGGSDLLEGGYGDDFIRGDAGDTMVGGAGTDAFSVYSGPGAPVLIKDYDPVNEEIQLVVAKSNQGELTAVDVEGGVELRVGNDTLAILSGAKAANIDLKNITVDRFTM